MKSLKKDSIVKRLAIGNDRANQVRLYLNHRFNANLEDYNGTSRDIKNGEDFGREELTFQAKVRDKYDDVIYEADKFIPPQRRIDKYRREILASREEGRYYEIRPGRDARTKAVYTIVKPNNEKRLLIVKTEVIKTLVAKTRSYLKLETITKEAPNGVECPVVNYTDDEIRGFWERANDFGCRNKSIVLFDKSGLQMTFKIDEGREEIYCKSIFYIPMKFFADDGKSLWIKDGENYCDPNTWQEPSGENLEDFLP